MSSSLNKACDVFLASTSILSHEYGVPSIDHRGSQTKPTAATYPKDQELLFLESTYQEKYQVLTAKLNELVYLNSLNELKKKSTEEIERLYKDKIEDNFDLLPNHNLDGIESFYQNQINEFQNKSLINGYLQRVAPILRSIHHNNTNLTDTEINIMKNLQIAFSSNNKEEDANINKLIENYQNNEVSEETYLALRSKLADLLEFELRPKLKEFKETNEILKTKQNELVSLKQSKVNQYTKGLETDDPSNQLLEDLKKLRHKFKQLIEEWTKISIFCDLLPSLIIASPKSWFNDKTLFNIIRYCEDTSEKFSKYQQVINIHNLKEFSIENLLMVNFDELTLSDYEEDDLEDD